MVREQLKGKSVLNSTDDDKSVVDMYCNELRASIGLLFLFTVTVGGYCCYVIWSMWLTNDPEHLYEQITPTITQPVAYTIAPTTAGSAYSYQPPNNDMVIDDREEPLFLDAKKHWDDKTYGEELLGVELTETGSSR
eukprot:Platyproteum_vivax@DN266_c0_g1_i1.p1